MTTVGIIIKTLNEEENIDRAIESSIKAVAPYNGEVIVADSGSTDHTIEKAMRFPVTVVQIADRDERCCGIGPQLGFQHSSSDYLYILDGDMELNADFIKRAISFLDCQPSVAGVGGYVNETRIKNLEFEARVKRQKKKLTVGAAADVECLVGGALYRRAAIEEVGYLSDRNLRAFEEYDLGVRLRKRGWRLVRLSDHAADHFSHEMNTFQLLFHRARSGYLFGIGDLLSAAISRGYIKNVLLEVRAMDLAIGVWLYWSAAFLTALLIARPLWVLIFLLTMMLIPHAVMVLRLRSIKLGIYSVVLWHVSALCLLVGLFRNRKSPVMRIQSKVFHTTASVP